MSPDIVATPMQDDSAQMTTPETDREETSPREDSAAARGGFFARRRSLKSPNEALQPETPPPPPAPKKKKRREGSLSAFSGFLSFMLIALVMAGFGIVSMQKHLREPGPLSADKVVYIAPGADVPEIIALLEREGVIDNPTLFNIELVVEQARGKLKAGEYLFRQNATMREVLDTLVNGRQVLHSVTIPEGLTSEQIVERLRESDILAGDLREIPREGTLLPETYKVARGMARADLVRKMQNAQKKLIDQVWSKRAGDLPLRSPLELVTLASIVEKETGRADERTRVAGVFINRLQKRMRLQSDPTIVYGLVGGRGTLGRGILRSEVTKYTAYNTYTIDGLPPGPIANPGRAAIEAVANPSRTQDLYFVADGTGGHVFADSLDQHNRNVQRWRQIEKEKGAQPAADRAGAGVEEAPPNAPGRRSDRGAAVFGKLASIDRSAHPLGEIALALTQEELARVRPVLPSPEELKELAQESTTQSARVDERENERAGEPARTHSKLSIMPDFNNIAVKVKGVDPNADFSDPVAEGGPEATETYPVAAKTLAGQRARSARLGLNPILDGPPPPLEAPTREELAVAGQPTAAEPRRPRAFDASEGTPLDPLRNKSWDLNSPKSIPANVLSYR